MFCYVGPECVDLLLKRDPGKMLCGLPLDRQRIRGKDAEQEKQHATGLSGHSKDVTNDEHKNS